MNRVLVLSDRRTVIGLAILLIATWMVYLPALDADFVNYDDNEYVIENPHIAKGLSAESLRWAITSTETGAYWMPLVWVSYLLDVEMYGMDPRGFHKTNLIFHLLNIVLLFLFLRSATSHPTLSLGVAALFALHPMHVESVAWISQRKDMISTFFWLLALWGYVRYTRTGHRGTYAAALIAMSLSLMGKATAVSLPVLLLLLDIWPLKRMRCEWRDIPSFMRSWRIREKVPFILIAILFAGITYATQQAGGAMRPDVYSLDVRILNALAVYSLYIWKTVWPTGLAAHYQHPGPAISVLPSLLSAAFLLAVTYGTIRKRAAHPWLMVGWFWYLITLLPMSGLIQVGGQAMGDRFMYMPHNGLFIMLLWGTAYARWPWPAPALGPRARRVAGYTLLGIVLLAHGSLARIQVGYWQDTETLFQRVLDVNPEDHLAHYNLGVEYMQRQEWTRAQRHFRHAMQYNPADYEAHINLALVYVRSGDYERAAAEFADLLRTYPDMPAALSGLGQALIHLNRHEEAAHHLRRAVEIDPDSFPARGNLSIALVQAGHHDEAMPHLEEALRHAPGHPGLLYHRGVARVAGGDTDAALRSFHAALEAGWREPRIYRDMGTTYLLKEDRTRAASYFREALRLNPSDLISLNNLAWLLATTSKPALRDVTEAIRLAEQAAALTDHQNASILGTLSTVYAAYGRFEEALETIERALTLVRETGSETLVREWEERKQAMEEKRERAR